MSAADIITHSERFGKSQLSHFNVAAARSQVYPAGTTAIGKAVTAAGGFLSSYAQFSAAGAGHDGGPLHMSQIQADLTAACHHTTNA